MGIKEDSNSNITKAGSTPLYDTDCTQAQEHSSLEPLLKLCCHGIYNCVVVPLIKDIIRECLSVLPKDAVSKLQLRSLSHKAFCC